MPYRKTKLVTNEIYHVVARGVAQAPIFKDKRDNARILETINFYKHPHPPIRFSHYNRLATFDKELILEKLKNQKPIVEIISFSLMPNHLHFLLKQTQEHGISIFMKNLQDSYARYFNTKYKRIGALFQSMFKAVRIENDEQLLHVSRYIHLNPVTSFLIEIDELDKYPWNSFGEYMEKRPKTFVNSSLILSFFNSKEEYRRFVFDQVDYQRKLNQIKHLLLEG